MAFAKLFEPLTAGHLTFKNRLVFPPMVSNLGGPKGESTDPVIAYYEERARGGAGTIIVEAAAVRWDGRVNVCEVGADDDALVPGLRRMASAIRRHGAVSVIQLNHCGRQGRTRVIGTQPICPSPVPCPIRKTMPRELPVEEIKDLVECYVAAAERSKAAGFDAVEVHGAHGYLVAQFLSPYVNKRQDEYGGDLERRMRFALEIVSGIRQRCGAGYPIFFRFSADEHVEGGLTLEETRIIARRLVEAGVAVLDVSAGTYESGFVMVPKATDPRGTLVPYAEAIKQVVSVPVICVGKITDPGFAEDVLRAGKADLVAVGRGLMADAEFGVKAEAGRANEIQKCVGCRNCMRATQRSMGIICAVNPQVGRELDFAAPAPAPQNVLVVGGGLAAMQAALVASLRGHKVTLATGEAELGGLLTESPGPQNFEAAMVVKMMATRLAREHVAIVREQGQLDDLRPDCMIVEGQQEGVLGSRFASLPQQSIACYEEPRALHAALAEGARAGLAIA